MEVALKQVWDGWAYLRTPDNLELVFTFESGDTVNVFAAVLELAELYDHVVKREPCNVMIGTGDIVEMEFQNDRATVILNEQHEEELLSEDLVGLFEDLLREVFAELDAVGSARARQQELDHHHEPVADLYERFSG